MEPVWLALIAAATGILSPLLLAALMNSSRRRDKKQDYDRQDAVAEKAQGVADQAAEAAKLLVAANERVAATTADTNSKLDVIHVLVNSNMTAAMQAEHDARSESLVLMLEIAELKRSAGMDLLPEAAQAIAITKVRIAELRATLDERQAHTRAAAILT